MDAKTTSKCDNLTIKALLITDLLKRLLQYTDINNLLKVHILAAWAENLLALEAVMPSKMPR
jgi:hypothetical protein